MRLSHKTEYALIALLELARADSPMSIRELSKHCKCSPIFLQQIFLMLRNEGYVSSTMGRYGGFRLKRQPREISVAELVRLFDEMLAPSASVSVYNHRDTPISNHPRALDFFREIRDSLAQKLEKTTLGDLL